MSFFDKLLARCCGKPDTEPGQRTIDRIGTSAALSGVWFQESKTEKLGENTMNSFDNNQAAKLRNAIQSTTSALAVLTASGSLQTVLQTHLAELLVRERALFGCDTEPKPVAKDTPWYPDDSGKWIEVPPGTRTLPPELDPDGLMEVLTYGERQAAKYTGLVRPAKGWLGLVEHIAAYKIVAPAAKANPWYPDDSGKWLGLVEHIAAYKIVEPAAKATPWYPDDSGKWVEVPPESSSWPPGLYQGARVEVLTRLERGSKTYRRRAELVLNWTHQWWRDGTIVAYKIVD